MRHGSLFSGIGGFDLASEWMEWENVFHCENNEFCQQVLKYYWPKAKTYGDIKTTDFREWRGKIDILTGGFPCQPYSTVGRKKGKEDDRHLWPEMLRAIREISPRCIVGENVSGLLNWSGGLVFDEVQADLEAQGYEVTPFLLPACSKNAPHKRERIWFIAYANKERYEHGNPAKSWALSNISKRIQNNWKVNGLGCYKLTPNSNYQGLQGSEINGVASAEQLERKKQPSRFLPSDWKEFPTQSPLRSGDDGLSSRLVRESISAAGNAVVPQVVFEIFKVIDAMANQWG